MSWVCVWVCEFFFPLHTCSDSLFLKLVTEDYVLMQWTVNWLSDWHTSFLFWIAAANLHQPKHEIQAGHTRRGERKFSGIAVALNPLINLLTEKGVQPPTAEMIKNNINIHNTGATKKAKQVSMLKQMARPCQGDVMPLKPNSRYVSSLRRVPFLQRIGRSLKLVSISLYISNVIIHL